jgi:hypothetical protein
MFSSILAISPTVQAAVESIIARITVGGTTVIMDAPPPVSTLENESYSLIWTQVSPETIQSNQPFFALLPTWIPSGYMLQERAALYYLSRFDQTPFSSLFEWRNDSGETIQLNILKGSCPNSPSHDPASGCTLSTYIQVGLKSQPEVIKINHQPAVLSTGPVTLADLSDPVEKWNPARWKLNSAAKEGSLLVWENDGRTFMLYVSSGIIAKEDLIHLAESIP